MKKLLVKWASYIINKYNRFEIKPGMCVYFMGDLYFLISYSCDKYYGQPAKLKVTFEEKNIRVLPNKEVTNGR